MSIFRYAARRLRKDPAFALAVIVILGLTIGANTAVFTVVDTLFFRPPPYPAPQRLAIVSTIQSYGTASAPETSQTGTQWELVRDHATTLDAASIYRSRRAQFVHRRSRRVHR